EPAPGILGESDDPVTMPAQQVVLCARLPQPLGGILPDRLQQTEARLEPIVIERDERLAHQSLQRIEHSVSLACHHLRSLEREPAREDRQPLEQRPFFRREQAVAPVEGRPECLLPAGAAASTLGQQSELIAEAGGYLLGGEYAQAARGQLQRE